MNLGGIYEMLTTHYELVLLAALIAIDILSGLTKAYKNQQLSSQLSREGMARKAAIIYGVALGYLVQPLAAKLGTGFDAPIGPAVALLFCVNEALSIIENLHACGVNVPSYLVRGLKAAQDTLNPEDSGDSTEGGDPISNRVGPDK